MISLSKNHINNIDKYKEVIVESSITIFTKYMDLICEYLKHCKQSIFIQNPEYYIFVVKRGINTISNVFKFLLIYTKNLEMVYYNCQKSYIYYVEFIGQIGDDNHSFLQLNSKDAMLFVYKKTIFEINNDIRKNTIIDSISKKKINNIDKAMNIYNNILYSLINRNNIDNLINTVDNNITACMNKIFKLYIDTDNNITDTNLNQDNKLEALYIFSLYFNHNFKLDHLEIFIKKLKKLSNINTNILKTNLINTDADDISVSNYINSITKQISI